MKLGKIGIILSILILVSILGQAAEPTDKQQNKKNPDSTKNHSIMPAAASATSPNESKSEDGDKVENAPSNAEEASGVKGVKKRGSSVSDSSNGPASLFDDEKGFLAGLDYPELQVVPRASERLQMEAQDEKNTLLGSYWPVQISAVALMVAGSTAMGKYAQENPTKAQKEENQFASQMGMLVGAMWLGGTYYLNHSLAYSKALPEIKKITGKDKKSLLLKERLSEEALERPAKVAKTINNLSISTNVILALYIATHSKQTRPSYAGWAIGLAFLPLLIENHIVENWEKHQEYKRKIYAPITRVDFAIDPQSQRLTPVLGMRWEF